MKIELTLTIRDGFWMLSSDDLPGLNLMGEPTKLMADFIPAWRKKYPKPKRKRKMIWSIRTGRQWRHVQ